MFASGLTAPGEICGITGTKLYFIQGVGANRGGTSIGTIDTTSAATGTAVTGLTAATACSMDSGGSGDVIVVDGGAILVLPAATVLPVTRSALTNPFTVTLATGQAISSIAGNTGTNVFYPFAMGYYSQTTSAVTINATVTRVSGAGTTHLYDVSDFGLISAFTVYVGAPGTSDLWFGGSLGLTAANTIYTDIGDPNYTVGGLSKISNANTASALPTPTYFNSDYSASSGVRMSVTPAGVYLAYGGFVYQLCGV